MILAADETFVRELQYIQRDGGTGLSIGQRMVMMLQVVTTGSGHGVQLMIRQGTTELSAGGGKGVVEAIVGIVHLVHSEHSFQTAFIKARIMGNKRQHGYPIPPFINRL